MLLCPLFYLYYLFDNKITDDIGSFSDILFNILEGFNPFNSLKFDNLYSVGLSGHETILYKFIYNDRKYIYYSNSGLGIYKQFYDNSDDTTSCKIFHVIDDKLSQFYNAIKPDLLANVQSLLGRR